MENKNIVGIFGALVSKANQTTNSEMAKKIRKNLIIWGIVGVVVSLSMLITGIVLFMDFSEFMDMSPENFGPSGKSITGMILFMLSSIPLAISISAIRAGLAIVVAGITTKIVDINNYCPKCGDLVSKEEMYCNKCGENLRANKICSCGHQNDIGDNFCTKCGKKIN